MVVIILISFILLSLIIGGGGALWWFVLRPQNFYVDKDDIKHTIELSTTTETLKDVKQLVLNPTDETKKVKLSHEKMELVEVGETYDEEYTTTRDIIIQLIANEEGCGAGLEYNTSTQTCERKFYKCQFIKILKSTDDTIDTKDGHLSLREIEVYDEAGDNVALNKTATSSSAHTSGGVTPDMAVNGVTNDIYYTGKTLSPEWWQVDLGSELNIAKIKVFRQGDDTFEKRLDGAKIQLLAADGTTVVHSVTAEIYDSTKTNSEEQEFTFDESVTTETFANTSSGSNKNYAFL